LHATAFLSDPHYVQGGLKDCNNVRRWHSIILDVRSFTVADCDTDHYLVVAEIRERFAVSKQEAQNF
jgi:hypothetical protein